MSCIALHAAVACILMPYRIRRVGLHWKCDHLYVPVLCGSDGRGTWFVCLQHRIVRVHHALFRRPTWLDFRRARNVRWARHEPGTRHRRRTVRAGRISVAILLAWRDHFGQFSVRLDGVTVAGQRNGRRPVECQDGQARQKHRSKRSTSCFCKRNRHQMCRYQLAERRFVQFVKPNVTIDHGGATPVGHETSVVDHQIDRTLRFVVKIVWIFHTFVSWSQLLR